MHLVLLLLLYLLELPLSFHVYKYSLIFLQFPQLFLCQFFFIDFLTRFPIICKHTFSLFIYSIPTSHLDFYITGKGSTKFHLLCRQWSILMDWFYFQSYQQPCRNVLMDSGLVLMQPSMEKLMLLVQWVRTKSPASIFVFLVYVS